MDQSIESRVTIHMVASLDGFIARNDGMMDWLETKDSFEEGKTLDPQFIQEFLASIDCYVMGSRTYETALNFERQGFGWVYGDKPVIVLTSRSLPSTRDTVQFYNGDLAELVNGRLRSTYRNIWIGGGGALAGACLESGLADEVRFSVMPVAIGKGIPFFSGLNRDVPLHLRAVNAYKSGMVELHYDVRHNSGGAERASNK